MKSPEVWIILFSTPIYILLIGIEIIAGWILGMKNYTIKDSVYNFVFMLFNGLVDLAFRMIYLIPLFYIYQFHLIEFDSTSFLYWFLLFLGEDFAFYWVHYLDHHVRLFWAVHVTHHNSEHFNLTTGFRSSIFQPLYRFVFFIPLVWIGFHPMHILIMFSITQIYGILVHTEFKIRLGWLSHIFVTPSHHSVHHASNVRYLDKNLGMCLIIWDKMFGTFQQELPEDPPVYGLTEQPQYKNIYQAIFGEFKLILSETKKQKSLLDKFKVVFSRPGWSPNGKSKTSKQLQMELKNAQ